MSKADLSTDRLTLRPVKASDATRITDLVNDERIYRMLARVPAHQTVAQTLAWISSNDTGRQDDTKHVYAIESDGLLVGMVSGERKSTFVPFDLRYWLAPDVWGRGLMTETAEALLTWLPQRGERAFVSGYIANNPPSRPVLEKAGLHESRPAAGIFRPRPGARAGPSPSNMGPPPA